jgi:molecular chaperone GrpE
MAEIVLKAMKKQKETTVEKQQMGEQEELIQDNPENQNPEKNSNDNQPKTDESAEIIQQLEIEIAEAKDKHLRLFSEFENYRR